MNPPLAVITGVSKGIGQASALYFLHHGWMVWGCSRQEKAPLTHENFRHFCVDLAKQDAIEGWIAAMHQDLQDRPVNALVNNAAQSPKTAYQERLGCLNGDVDKWREVFSLNLFAPLQLARGLATHLGQAAQHNQSAAIINMTSIAGHAVHPFAGSAYSTSKAALSALTREMAVEFAQIGVRVNAIAPGEIKTSMIGAEYEPLTNRIPLQRMGTVEEVATVIFQLCSTDFSYVTGSEIYLTGGQHVY